MELVTLFLMIFQQVSVGFSSGEYVGRYSIFILCACFSISSFIGEVLWYPTLSMMNKYFFRGCFLRNLSRKK